MSKGTVNAYTPSASRKLPAIFIMQFFHLFIFFIPPKLTCAADAAHHHSMKADCSALMRFHNRRQYSQSGLSASLFIPACPSDVCVAVRVNTPIHAAAVRSFHCKTQRAREIFPDSCGSKLSLNTLQHLAVALDYFLIPCEAVFLDSLFCSVSAVVLVYIDETVALAHLRGRAAHNIQRTPRVVTS